MKTQLTNILFSDFGNKTGNIAMFLFRIAFAIELMLVHGLKKIDADGHTAEIIPNPLGFPDWFNQAFATVPMLVFPFFILIGLFTRLAALPALAVTLTGYFIVHANDALAEKDAPFTYSIILLLIVMLGAGRYSVDNFLAKRFR